MKCKKCRKQIDNEDYKFCPWCGIKFENQKYYRNPNGLYEKSITVNGKRKKFRAKTIKELEKKLIEFNIELENKKSPLFLSVAEQWEKETYERIAHTTYTGYKPKCERAKEYFADTQISDITIKEVSKYFAEFPKSWSKKTYSSYRNVLSLIFDFACRQGIIEHNPVEYTVVPKNLSKTYRRAVTDGEIEIIKNNVDAPCGLLAFFFVCSGLRRGEALALQWQDIDFENKLIYVNKSLYHKGNQPYIKAPKTEKGRRSTFLVDILAEKLKPLQGNDTDLVFPDDKTGTYFTKMAIQRRWEKWQKITGLTDVTPHVARHGFATICFNAGLDIKDVQDIVGHAQYSTTADIYTHLTDKRKQESFEKLNKFLK